MAIDGNTTCAVPGCGAPISGANNLCEEHRLAGKRGLTARAKQHQDNVPKSPRSIVDSPGLFDGSPTKMSVADLENACLDGLGWYHTVGQSAKEANATRREIKEKLTPWLRTLRSKLNHQGQKGTGWQSWCEAHRAELGISRKTADRWIDGPEEKKKYANLDSADGIVLAGKKYSFKVIVKNDRIERIEVEPAAAADVARSTAAGVEQIEQVVKSVAPKRLDAASTKEQIDKFFAAYKRGHKDDGSSKWAEGFLAALAAESEKHPEWRRGTAKRNFQTVRQWIHARGVTEDDQAGWTKKDRKTWTHEDGRFIRLLGKEYITFDKDSVSIRPTYSLIEAMREKREELSEPAKELAAVVGDVCPEDEAL